MDLAYFIIALVAIAVAYFKNKKLIRVEWETVAKFSGFLLLLMAVRFAQLEAVPQQAPPEVSFSRLPLVFWEDAFFSLFAIYFFKDYLKKSKVTWITLTVLSSIEFGLGHIYQGVGVAVLMCFMPYFVSYRIGKKHGWGTMMVCHILYDFTTLLTMKLASLFYLLRV